MRAFAGPEIKLQRAEMHLSYLIQEESRFWANMSKSLTPGIVAAARRLNLTLLSMRKCMSLRAS
ncbi:hypothetical protein CO665_02310 [Rhizobium anhuiense]|nr:hypothetical protein CO665_02310 [Rhizobium anhuiense]